MKTTVDTPLFVFLTPGPSQATWTAPCDNCGRTDGEHGASCHFNRQWARELVSA